MNWRRKEGRNLRRNGNKTKVGRNRDTGRKGEKEAVIRSTEIERKQIGNDQMDPQVYFRKQ